MCVLLVAIMLFVEKCQLTQTKKKSRTRKHTLSTIEHQQLREPLGKKSMKCISNCNLLLRKTDNLIKIFPLFNYNDHPYLLRSFRFISFHFASHCIASSTSKIYLLLFKWLAVLFWHSLAVTWLVCVHAWLLLLLLLVCVFFFFSRSSTNQCRFINSVQLLLLLETVLKRTVTMHMHNDRRRRHHIHTIYLKYRLCDSLTLL